MERTPDAVLTELLVLRAQRGDAAAFTALAQHWQRRLLRHAALLTGAEDAAADVVQETWLAVAQGLCRLDDPACFPRWAFQIATRKSADWVRARQRDRRLVAELAARPPAVPALADDLARLRAGLRQLPGDRRALLALVYLDGLPLADVALALGIPAGTVKSRLYHARQELKDLLERSDS